jgi:hypothetical protein
MMAAAVKRHRPNDRLVREKRAGEKSELRRRSVATNVDAAAGGRGDQRLAKLISKVSSTYLFFLATTNTTDV